MLDAPSYVAGYMQGRAAGGGGGDITVEALSATENGTYTAPSGKAYSPVTVAVPNSYTAGDEGKVVSNGALVAQTAHAKVTSNGTIDTTLNNSVEVDVSGGIGPTWAEVISASACANIKDCINALLGGATLGKNYEGALFDKAVEDYTNNQLCYFISINRTADTATIIPYIRYRNGSYNPSQGNTMTYDASIEVGDKFYICEV